MENARMQKLMLLLLLGVVGCGQGGAEVLSGKRIHLRSGSQPEWDEFQNATPQSNRLDLQFEARRNSGDQTLLVRQYNVKQEWPVLINDQKIGILFLMEDPLTAALRIPGGALRDGANTLSILPPKENDDVIIERIELLQAAPSRAYGGKIDVRVTETGRPVPCRITVVDQEQGLAGLHVTPTNGIAARPGVVYAAQGAASIALRPGTYTVLASRGPEYNVATQRVAVVEGRTLEVPLALEREVPTPGLVSTDTHIHTFTHAKHGDATLHERMVTIAGEGLELPVSTEHNLLADFREAAKKIGVESRFTPVLGCEVTTKRGHFNVFPITPESRVPDFRIEHWPALMENIRATPGVQFVVLNHPRDVHSGFTPFAETNFNSQTGENLRGFEFSFDGVELINSGALRTDPMQVFHDWFALLNYGYKIVGVAASDSHDVSRFIVGQGRTYIMCKDSDAGQIDIGEAMANLRKGKALISLGLIVMLKVEEHFEAGDVATIPGKTMKITGQVLGPSWARANRIELYANGRRIVDQPIESTARVEKLNASWKIPKPEKDFHLIAVASGPGVRSLHWAIPRPYQAASPQWTPRLLAATNPIWVDADGDGKFTPLRKQNGN